MQVFRMYGTKTLREPQRLLLGSKAKRSQIQKLFFMIIYMDLYFIEFMLIKLYQ